MDVTPPFLCSNSTTFSLSFFLNFISFIIIDTVFTRAHFLVG